MALTQNGDIAYRNDLQTGVYLQTDPPVCNACEQTITRENFGWAYQHRDEKSLYHHEMVECIQCTEERATEPARERFFALHNL